MGTILYHAIVQPEMAGWTVHVYAVVEYCAEETDKNIDIDTIIHSHNVAERAVAQFRQALGDRVVSWETVTRNPLTIDGNDTVNSEPPYNLRPEVLLAHPLYPYLNRPAETNPHRVLFMANKLKQVKQAREKSNVTYDIVMRLRPDTLISSQIDWAVSPFASVTNVPSNNCAYITPMESHRGAHSDEFAIMTQKAADLYDSMYDNIDKLYQIVSFHPEILCQENMRGCHSYRTNLVDLKLESVSHHVLN